MFCHCFPLKGLLAVSNLVSLISVKVCKLTSWSCFPIFSRTLTGIIDNYFGGYYTEKLVEAQVGLCLQYHSPVWRWLDIFYFVAFTSTFTLHQWPNTLLSVPQIRKWWARFCKEFSALCIHRDFWHVGPLFSCTVLSLWILSTGGPAGIWAVGAWTLPKIMWVLSFTEPVWDVLFGLWWKTQSG
jgi:hypothetical protein